MDKLRESSKRPSPVQESSDKDFRCEEIRRNAFSPARADLGDLIGEPLQRGVADGRIDILEYLAKAGIDLNAIEERGDDTALHVAIGLGLDEVVGLFVVTGPTRTSMTIRGPSSIGPTLGSV